MSSIVINHLNGIENYSYLELGIGDGNNFRNIKAINKVCVDVNGEATFNGTTDEYFEQLSKYKLFDIIFIDANHDHPFVIRDFNNSVKHAKKWILLHDMIPPSEFYTHTGACSDSYKILYHMLRFENFEIYPMDCNFGLTLIKAPFKEIFVSEETKNLSYSDFMSYLSYKKLWSEDEIRAMLQGNYSD